MEEAYTMRSVEVWGIYVGGVLNVCFSSFPVVVLPGGSVGTWGRTVGLSCSCIVHSVSCDCIVHWDALALEWFFLWMEIELGGSSVLFL